MLEKHDLMSQSDGHKEVSGRREDTFTPVMSKSFKTQTHCVNDKKMVL